MKSNYRQSIVKRTVLNNTCANCLHIVGEYGCKNNFCSNCGSKLDWSEILEADSKLTNREKVIKFCKGALCQSNDISYLDTAQTNLSASLNGTDNFEGCPSNYGLDDAEDICDRPENKTIQDPRDMDKMCKKCWKLALQE